MRKEESGLGNIFSSKSPIYILHTIKYPYTKNLFDRYDLIGASGMEDGNWTQNRDESCPI
jgi:hypothetical protein